ncbi:DNA-protecting protein DprA [Patescibacteria group bacterium]|nr:DNA-protecting protein DprA [Patescibacteria group bacterium]
MGYIIRQLAPSDFPKLLEEIPDAPKRLFAVGPMPHRDSKCLCVVGSRKYSSYGREVCEKLIVGLRGYNVTIISGLALGIDALAHRNALTAGLATVAIPGSGLGQSVLYPSANRGLAEAIIASGGALLSEFEESERATPYNFPRRNRIMAGMSHAVLVIEAERQSGTLITSRLATDYNRDVLTVPHPIFSNTSHGPHMLLRLGAAVITDAEDIVKALGINTKHNRTADNKNLSERERKVVELLNEPLPRDELIALLNISIQDANILLSAMEIKGLIREQYGELHSI